MNQYLSAIHGGVSALLLIIVGYICTWLKLVPLKDFSSLNLFTAKCCFFFMTFKSLAGKDKSQLDFRPLLISTLMSLSLYIILAVFIIFILPKSFFKHKQTTNQQNEESNQATNYENNINQSIENNKNFSENSDENLSNSNDNKSTSSTPDVLFEEVIIHPNHHHHDDDEEKSSHQNNAICEMNSVEINQKEKKSLKRKKNLFKKKKMFDSPEDKFGIFLSTAFPTVYVNYLISGLPIFLSLWDESETATITMMLITNEIVSLPILLLLSNFRRVYVAKKEIKKKKERNELEKIDTLSIKESNSDDQVQVVSSSPSNLESLSTENKDEVKSVKQFSIDDNVDTEEASSNSAKSNDSENIKQESTDSEITKTNEEASSNSAKSNDSENIKQESTDSEITKTNEEAESSKNNEKEEEDKEEAVQSKETISNSNESNSNESNSNSVDVDKNSSNNNESISDTKKVDNNKIDEDEEEFVFSAKKIVLEILSTLIHNMFLVGIVAGFVYLAITSKVCTFLYQLMTLLSNCVLPFSLFSVGAYLSSQSLISCNWMVFLFSLIGRLIVGPVLAGAFCYALKFPGRLARQCIVIATMPTRVTCAAITENEGLGVGVSSTMIMWSCVFMVPMVVLWMWVLNYTHLFED